MSGALSMILAAGASMNVVLVGSADAHTTGASLAIAKPTGVLAGDLLIAVCAAESGGATWTGDTGWTEVAEGGSQSLRVAWKIAGASEPSTYTFTASGSVHQSGFVIAFRGGAYDVAGTIANATGGATLTIGGVTLSREGLLLAICCSNFSGRAFSTPTDMIPVLALSSSNASLTLFSQAVGAGATGSRATTPSAGSSSGILIGVKAT